MTKAMDKIWAGTADIKAAVAAERERCAKIADAARKDDPTKQVWLVAFDIANEIRRRSFEQ